jgi:outer membrane protein assembly factor BamB
MNRSSTARWIVSWTGCLAMAGILLAGPRSDDKTPVHWAYWRGPSGQGYSDDTKVPLTWSETENIVWKTKLPGVGNSSPIVWGDHIFLTAATKDGQERYVLCVRRSDGKLLWQKTASKGVAPGRTHAWNGYASASCATDGKHVYAFFGTPGLFCYDFKGNLVWNHTFGIFTSETGWGTAASPFLYEDLVVVNCDNDGPRALPSDRKPEEAAPMALVALDKGTGKIRWQTERNMGRGFSTPRLIRTPQGREDLVLNSPQGVWAYNPRTGKEIWHCDRKGEQARFGEPIPVISGDTLFAPSGRPGPMQAIRLGGQGDVTQTHIRWQVKRKGRDVSSQMVWGDQLYAADRSGILTCYDVKDGKVLFTGRLSLNSKSLASPVAVRGKLLWVLDTGESVVLEPGRTLKVAGRNKLGDGVELDFMASPAIVDGKLFLRSQSHLYCIGAKK